MKFNEIIRAICKNQNVKLIRLGERLGVGKSNISMLLSRNDTTISTFIDTLNAIDYKIVVIPKGTKLPADSYEVTK